MNAQVSRHRATSTYRDTQVRSRSPLELVVMLYDGAIRDMTSAKESLVAGDLPRKRESMSRALAIVSELQSTLNMKEGGEVAERLDGLYTYVNGRLLEANMKGDTNALDEALSVFTTVREAWAQIAAQPPQMAEREVA